MTLHDVARKAKVSIKTASRVVNEEPNVADATRQRVQAAIKALGYRPNSLARSMRTNRSDTLGLIVPSIRNPFYPAIARGIEDVARAYGRTVIVTSADRDPARERQQIALLVGKRVDGIILGSPVVGPRALEPALAAGVPVVAMNPNVALPGAHVLRIGNRGAAIEMMDYLVSLGHQEIAYIDGPPSLVRSRERAEGYRAALERAGIAFRADLVEDGGFDYDLAYRAARKLLERQPRPTCIFGGNDLMAIGAIAAALDLGLTVPGDVSVAGFDDIDLASVFRPSLTTVHQPNYEMGRQAAEIILNPDERRRGFVRTMETRVVVRQSTAAPARVSKQEPGSAEQGNIRRNRRT
jgi:LacI family transcriptional regulator